MGKGGGVGGWRRIGRLCETRARAVKGQWWIRSVKARSKRQWTGCWVASDKDTADTVEIKDQAEWKRIVDQAVPAREAVPIPDVVPPTYHTAQGVTSPAKPESALLPAGMHEGRHIFGAVTGSSASARSSSILSHNVNLGSARGAGHEEEDGQIKGTWTEEETSIVLANPWPTPPTAH